MNAKKVIGMIFVSIFVVLSIIVLSIAVPTKEEKIYSYIENDQYEEADVYIARKGIEILNTKNKKAEEVKNLLFEKYLYCNEKMLVDETFYEDSKMAYQIGEKLFPNDLRTSESAKSLKNTLDIFDACETLKGLADAKKYTQLLNDISTSKFISNDTYKAKVNKIISAINNNELYKVVDKEVDESLKSKDFAEIPAFVKNENELINICITPQQVNNIKTKIDASNNSKTCVVSGCKKIKSSGTQYCDNHLCNESGCKNYTSKTYCSAHTCIAYGCDSSKESGGSYCYSHTCSESDCYRYTSENYCSSHECIKSGCDDGRSYGSSYCYSHKPGSSSGSSSVSSGVCFWCKGAGSVKYYYGNGDYDYEYGRCGSCLGTGRARD